MTMPSQQNNAGWFAGAWSTSQGSGTFYGELVAPSAKFPELSGDETPLPPLQHLVSRRRKLQARVTRRPARALCGELAETTPRFASKTWDDHRFICDMCRLKDEGWT